MSITSEKEISKLAIVSVVFLILGFLALPICKSVQRVMDRQELDYTRMGVHLFSIALWSMALLLALLAAVLIFFKQKKEKSLWLPLVCIMVSLMVIIVYSVPLPEYENTVVVDREKTFDGESSQLEKTMIVAALDSPIPKGKNVIWCSSFQLAWNELKDDIVKEPILLSENQEIANLLNQADQSKHDVSESDYYARAGFVQDNIIQTIQTEMAQQFPEEPVPSFDNITPLTAIISYSYLTANVRFKFPYFENDKELLFTDSNGNKTPITSFGIREEDEMQYKLRNQMNILFVNRNSDYQLKECAIDLCEKSSPNQIVLAMIEPKETLLETISYIDEQYKKAPEEKYFHKFGSVDILLVPNLFWKIAHSYKELEGPFLQNAGYDDMWIAKAMQIIQFRLDRSGAELKSEAKLYADAAGPTYYVFDRPFLIYMKKRGAKYPFFAMWVDNAELLERFQ